MKYLFFYFFIFCCHISYSQDTTKIRKLFVQAMEYEEKGDLQSALKTQLEVFKLDPKNYVSASIVAGLYGKLEMFDDEINWANKSILILPSFGAYINLGNGYVGKRDFENAEKNYNQAATLDSLSPLPFYSLGVLEENKNNLPVAIKFYEKSVLLDSTFGDGYFNLAAAYANMKNFKKANENILKYLELHPSDKEAQEMHEHIILEILKQ